MRSVVTLVTVVLISVSAFAQGTAKPAPVDKALAPLQGTWVVNDINGKPAGSMLLVFKGDKYEQVFNDAVNERGTVKLNTKEKPTAIDLAIQEGQDANKLQLGIIEVTGDKMRLNLAAAGATTRPKTFSSEGGFFMVNLTRRK